MDSNKDKQSLFNMISNQVREGKTNREVVQKNIATVEKMTPHIPKVIDATLSPSYIRKVDKVINDILNKTPSELYQLLELESQSKNVENARIANQSKPRKKRIPLQRETSEALLLIDELLESKNVSYLDQFSAIKAWSLIVSKEFKSDYIKIYPEHENSHIVLNGGSKLNKSDFLEKYRKRFKKV